MPGESYRRRLRSLLCLCDVFRALINSLVCSFIKFSSSTNIKRMQQRLWTDRRTDSQTNGQTDEQTVKRTDRQTNRQRGKQRTDTQIDGQTNRRYRLDSPDIPIQNCCGKFPEIICVLINCCSAALKKTNKRTESG